MTNVRELVDHEFEQLIGPLRTLVEQLDERIDATAKELDELREQRKRAGMMLRNADPTFEAESRPGRKPGKLAKSNGKPYSDSKYQELLAWLEAQDDLGEFSPSSLVLHDEWHGLASASYTSAILNGMHERGVVRLVRRGRGGSKIYAVA